MSRASKTWPISRTFDFSSKDDTIRMKLRIRAKGGNMKRSILALVMLPAFLLGLPASGHESLAQELVVDVKEVEPFTYCSVSHKGPISDIQDVIGQLMLELQNQNLQPTGPMFGIIE